MVATSITHPNYVLIPDNDTLVFILYQHVPVHVVSQRPDVGWVLIGCLQK